MQSYLISLITAALIAALVGILAPEGERGGLGKHLKLIASLFLICILIVPLKGFTNTLQELIDGNWAISLPNGELSKDELQSDAEKALDEASEQYFADALGNALCTQFALSASDVRCTVNWERIDGESRPVRVTVFLSGRAIWQDTHAIEAYVNGLLGCACITAIE